MGWHVPLMAAAAKRRREEKEETEMMRRLQEEMDDEWEFKVMRSYFAAFGNPQKLQHMLDEEARAGWEMAGKLDDSRIYLKRPKSAREGDPLLGPGVDPYRTQYGGMGGGSAALVVAGLLLLGVFAFGLLAVGRGLDIPPVIAIVGAVIFVGMVVVLLARRR